MDLILQDSTRHNNNREQKDYFQQSAGFMQAVDELKKRFVDGSLQIISLQSYNPATQRISSRSQQPKQLQLLLADSSAMESHAQQSTNERPNSQGL